MTHDTRTRWFLVSSKAAKALRLLETGTSFKSNVLEMELPRLTRALREFGGVSPRLSREPVELDEAVLLKKREKTKKGSEDGRNSWGKVSEDVVAQCGKHNSVKVWPRTEHANQCHWLACSLWPPKKRFSTGSS